MSDWGRINGPALDRYITGNYGEDQFRGGDPELEEHLAIFEDESVTITREPEWSPYLQPPAHPLQTHRFIRGQLCWWDSDPAEEWGQVWIPVCLWCRRGPLEASKRVCGSCPPAYEAPVVWGVPW